MTPIESLVIILLLCGLLSVASYRFGLLTSSGSIASFAVGSLIGFFGSIYWLLLLIAFTVSGFLVTKYKFEIKKRDGVQEGKKGERTYLNVIANGLVPTIIALAYFFIGEQGSDIAALVYLCAISEAASDTIASELGVLSSRVRLITNLKPVPVGTNGGISAYGTMWAFNGALFASILGWAIIFPGTSPDLRFLIPVTIGFLGCNVDSLIGATWETKGYVGKLGNNILSMVFASVLGLIILTLLF